MKNINRIEGISLIALIITIILLLILAGITIQSLSGSGLFKQTETAKIEYKRANIKEYLSLKVIEEQTKYKNVRKIIEETRENVIKNIKDLEEFGKDIKIDEVEEEENEIYFYVRVDNEVYKVSLGEITFVGKYEENKKINVGDIKFEYNPSGWTNGKVIVKVNSSLETRNLKIQTSKDAKNWETTDTQVFETNGAIYARLAGVLGQTQHAVGNVEKIDTMKPVVTKTEATTNEIKIEATDTAKVNEKASGIIGYAVTESTNIPIDAEFTEVDNTKELSITVNEKTQGKTYYVWVKDEAGNISESKIAETGKVAGLTTANTTFTYTPSTWTNNDVTVTASTSLATGEFTIQTSKNASKWDDTVTQTYSANGPIYARLVDKTKQAAITYGTGNVEKIDKVEPVIKSFTGTVSSTISTEATLSTTVNDANSGLSTIEWEWGTTTSYGSKDVKTYTIKNGSTKGTIGDVTKTYPLTGLSSNTKYYAKITVYDVAGNKKVSTTEFTTGIAVAQVGSTLYNGIQYAVNAISSSGTVKQLVSVTENVNIPAGKTITFDTNGKTLYGYISNSGTLNINGNGTIQGVNNSIINNGRINMYSVNLISQNGWTVTNYADGVFWMFGGEIKNTANTGATTVFMNFGYFYMRGGTIKGTHYGLVTDEGISDVRFDNRGEIIIEANVAILSDSTNNRGVKGVNYNSQSYYEQVKINGDILSDYEDRMTLANCNIPDNRTVSGKAIEVKKTSLGYNVYLYDSRQIYSNVKMPTWAPSGTGNTATWFSASTATIHNSKTWYVEVRKSYFNNEIGVYNTHIYAENQFIDSTGMLVQ